ncbi:uncharacterized protein G2W53_011490 [Senna tora]|uniref:Uncharacterized protein n=1 Tax=Senna tora TaxID=362788 RepID=A0A834X1S2_9FABA|nr:uncharacterized protein G2W53_011490 [Senna tora]
MLKMESQGQGQEVPYVWGTSPSLCTNNGRSLPSSDDQTTNPNCRSLLSAAGHLPYRKQLQSSVPSPGAGH